MVVSKGGTELTCDSESRNESVRPLHELMFKDHKLLEGWLSFLYS